MTRAASSPFTPRWSVHVTWPDGRHEHLEIYADTQELAERYPLEVWGQSVTAIATPFLAAR